MLLVLIRKTILYTTKVLVSVGICENDMYCCSNIRGCYEGKSTSCLKVNFVVGKRKQWEEGTLIP